MKFRLTRHSLPKHSNTSPSSRLGWASSLVVGVLLASTGVFALPSSASDVLNNGKFRFAEGARSAISLTTGFLREASYYNATSATWRILSHPGSPDLNLAFGYGSGGLANKWNGIDWRSHIEGNTLVNMSIQSGPTTTSSIVSGSGTLIVTTGYTLTTSKTIEVRHEVILEEGKSFVRVNTSIKNTSATELSNFHLWVGTQDDYVGTSDTVTKTRGNLSGGNFSSISAVTQSANAVEVTNGTETVYFYSPTSGVNSIIKAGCCTFANLLDVGATSASNPVTNTSDGQYAFNFAAGNISPNASASITWYWIAGATTEISSILDDVAETDASASATVSPSASNATELPFRAPRIPRIDAFESGAVVASPGKALVLNGTRLNCTTQVKINGVATSVSYSLSSTGLEGLSIGIPSDLNPGRHKLEMDSCDGKVVYENALVVSKPPVVFEAVTTNRFDRMFVTARLQSFVLQHYSDYNSVECLVNSTAKSLEKSAVQFLENSCKLASMSLAQKKGYTTEKRSTHIPANIWIRVTLTNK